MLKLLPEVRLKEEARMNNTNVGENLFSKIEKSSDFELYTKRWKNYFLFIPILFFLFTLLISYFKYNNLIHTDISLNPLYLINIFLFLVFIHTYYKNSYDKAIIAYYQNNKNILNKVEVFVLEEYIKILLVNTSLFQQKKTHFLFHVTYILEVLNEKEKEEIYIVSNLDNF